MKAIVIEHDRHVMEDIVVNLKIRWPDCHCFSTDQGKEGIHLVDAASPDLVILDLEALDMDGFEAIKEIRKISTVPLVALSRIKDDEAAVVKAFNYGADRFINKPFRALEFLSRVNALLRRTNGDKYYRHEIDMEELLVASVSNKEASQSQEENRSLEPSSVN